MNPSWFGWEGFLFFGIEGTIAFCGALSQRKTGACGKM